MAMERMNGLRIGVAALIAGFVVSQGVLAEPSANAQTVHRTIDVRALNLSSQAGAQQVYRLIAEAAQNICASTGGDRGVARVTDQRERVQPCFDAAVNGALEQIAKATGIDLKQVAGHNLTIRDNLVAGR